MKKMALLLLIIQTSNASLIPAGKTNIPDSSVSEAGAAKSRIFLHEKWIDLPFDLATLPGIKELFERTYDKKRAEKILIIMGMLALIHHTKGGEIHYSKKTFLSEEGSCPFRLFEPWQDDDFEERLCARRTSHWSEEFTYRVRYLTEEELQSLLSQSIHKKSSLPFIREMLGLFPNEPLNFTTLNEKLWETEPTIFYDCEKSDT